MLLLLLLFLLDLFSGGGVLAWLLMFCGSFRRVHPMTGWRTSWNGVDSSSSNAHSLNSPRGCMALDQEEEQRLRMDIKRGKKHKEKTLG